MYSPAILNRLFRSERSVARGNTCGCKDVTFWNFIRPCKMLLCCCCCSEARFISRLGITMPETVPRVSCRISRARAPHCFLFRGWLTDRTHDSFKTLSQNCEKRLLASSCLSVRPHGKTRLPLDGFSWNLVFEYFSKYVKNFKFRSDLTRITGTLQ
jgi:hypothetical protein